MKSKKYFLFLIVFLLFKNVQAQTSFEKGYVIDENNKKIDCFINNQDWDNTPTSFEYKLNETSNLITGTLNNIKEFGIPGKFKFKKFKIEVDRVVERANLNDLDNNPQPNYTIETVFLNVLVEGKASLYMLTGDLLRLYFYDINTHNPTQLYYKRYKKENQIIENNQYKQQLFLQLNCQDISMGDEETLTYDRKKLINYFEKYNACQNSSFTSFSSKTYESEFNLYVKPRVYFSSLNLINNFNDIRSVDFENQTIFSASIEAEYLLKFKNSAWSAFIEPSYFSFKENKQIDFQEASVNYSYIESAFGVRYYIYLGDKSKLFLNAAYVHYFDLDSNVKFEIETAATFDFQMKGRTGLGAGYNFNNKISVEYRFYLGRKDILNSNVYTSEFTNAVLMIGYNLL